MGLFDSLLRRAKDAAPEVTWAAPPPGGTAAIYQIFYDDKTRAKLDPGFLPMDNSRNVRPDWREYYPMRAFLLAQPLDESRHYGFFSPKFRLKTDLVAAQVHRFVDEQRAADVILFSPFGDLQALFPNVFVQGEYFHPGLIDTAEAFFGEAGFDVDLRALVTDLRRSVFCNFIVARPAFWREWLRVNEQLFRYCEGRGPLRKLLTARARYLAGEEVQFKIFIQERVADLLLATQDRWTTAQFPESVLSMISPFRDDVALVQQCNGLKALFRDTGDSRYMDQYHQLLRERRIPQPGDEDPQDAAGGGTGDNMHSMHKG